MTTRKSVTLKKTIAALTLASTITLVLSGCEILQSALTQVPMLQQLLSGQSTAGIDTGQECDRSESGEYILMPSWPTDVPAPVGKITWCLSGIDEFTGGNYWFVDTVNVPADIAQQQFELFTASGFQPDPEYSYVLTNSVSYVELVYDDQNDEMSYVVRNLAPGTAVVPATWPSEIPTMGYPLTSSNQSPQGTTQAWSLGYRVPDSNVAMAEYSALLTQSGYALVRKSEDVQTGSLTQDFENGTYTITLSASGAEDLMISVYKFQN